MKIDRTGEIGFNSFGSLMFISEYRSNKDIDVYFPHRDWTAKHVQYNNFKNKSIKCPYEPRLYNKGYVGEGKYKTRENGKSTDAYKSWKGMMQRCYDVNSLIKHPTYNDCTVCDEWLNFQNFAEWYEKNYYEIPEEKMALDKDILIKGNKIYSPSTCVFVPQDINSLFIKRDASRGNLPIGVSYDSQSRKYITYCKKNNKNEFLGRYNTPEEAFMVYKIFKERHIKKVADTYQDLIPQSLYNAMYEYEVENED